jgi:uncharacterized membrane protein (DUF2068 family)
VIEYKGKGAVYESGGNIMERHINNLGVLFIIWGIISILCGIGILLLFTSGILDVPHRAEVVLMTMGAIVSSFCIGTGILEIIGGKGLLGRRRWSRMLSIVMAVINLSSFPLGVALGVYGLWVLFKTESKQVLIA